jgi:hypothetical protein
MTSQEAKQHIKKAQENPEKYHFEWFFDDDGEEITQEPDEPEEDILSSKEFKELSWAQRTYIRIKVATWRILNT